MNANSENKHYAYHIFSGTMDSNYKQTETEIAEDRVREFELVSYDIVGNKQNIKGVAVNHNHKCIYLKGYLDTLYGLSGTFDSSKKDIQ